MHLGWTQGLTPAAKGHGRGPGPRRDGRQRTGPRQTAKPPKPGQYKVGKKSCPGPRAPPGIPSHPACTPTHPSCAWARWALHGQTAPGWGVTHQGSWPYLGLEVESGAEGPGHTLLRLPSSQNTTKTPHRRGPSPGPCTRAGKEKGRAEQALAASPRAQAPAPAQAAPRLAARVRGRPEACMCGWGPASPPSSLPAPAEPPPPHAHQSRHNSRSVLNSRCGLHARPYGVTQGSLATVSMQSGLGDIPGRAAARARGRDPTAPSTSWESRLRPACPVPSSPPPSRLAPVDCLR